MVPHRGPRNRRHRRDSNVRGTPHQVVLQDWRRDRQPPCGIEAVLEPLYPPKANEKGPVLAVVAREGAERPDIVLVASFAVERAEVNSAIQRAGLSALHYVRAVVQVPEIPTLGTGKTDYRGL